MTEGVLPQLGYYCRAVKRLQRAIGEIRPDLHVPVDSPALNWHLAAAAKKAGAKVAYYIAPQVWAWAPWRVRKLVRLTDHVLCILPFEEDWLRRRGVKATYVGHPLFDQLPPRPKQLADIMGAWAEGNLRVALLPGSRPAEIRGHCQALAAAAKAIARRWGQATCTFAAGDRQAADVIKHSLGRTRSRFFETSVGKTHQVLAESHFAVAVSGTVTLEAAYFGVPMVIFYRASRIGYSLLGRWLVRTPNLSLVNILSGGPSGRKIVPELMPWFGSERKLIAMVLEVMEDLGYLLEVREKLLELTDSLKASKPHGRKSAPAGVDASQSASDNAADLIAEMLER